jgi:hypothetical protein
MNKVLRILISAALLCFVCAGTAAAQTINIDPSYYTGLWTVDYGLPHQGPTAVDLGPVDPVVHAHVISLGGAEFFFNVGPNGEVSVSPSAAATSGRGWLRFNTTTIKVNPGFYGGRWRVVAGATDDLVGLQRITLVSGLRFYNLELGATGGFSFHVAADGTVTIENSVAANGGANSLKVNHTDRFLK